MRDVRSPRQIVLESVLLGLALAASCSVTATADEPSSTPEDSLEPIVVRSEKLSVESLIDRKVYTVTSDAQSTFGTLSDILGNIPSVDVDATGIVSLRGDTKVLILIDGKPSAQFAGASAGDNLQSIPAGDIERIEVLTTPPAEFKADGVAGVINIITRKHGQESNSASLQSSAGTGGRYIIGADGDYGDGPLSAAVSAGYRQDYKERRTESTVIAPNPPSGQLISSNSINELIRREIPTVKLSAGYELNDRQSISGSAKWDDRGGLRTYTQLTDSSTPDGVITGAARRLSSGHDPETDYDGRLAFSQKLDEPGETLDLALHRSISHQYEHYDYRNDSFVPPSATFYDNLSFHEDNGSTDFDADYVRPISKTRTLKVGYAFEQDDYGFDNVGANVDPTTGDQLIDPALTNEFRFRQSIHAAYASYQADWGAWTGLGGLRAEEVHTDARQLTNALSTTGSYFQVYPSLHLDRSLSDQSTLSFGASRRVTRPDPSYLNPYVDYEYTPNLSAGNPNLKPQYSQSYEVGYGYEGKGRSYTVTGYYRLDRDAMTDVTEYLANGVSLTTKTNLPNDRMGGMEFSADGHILPKLAYGISGNLFYAQIDTTALGIPGLQSTTGINLKAKLDYRPTEAGAAQITLTRTDKRLTPQGYVSAINLVNLGYRYRLKAGLTAVATVTDLFNGQRFNRYSTSAAFTEDYQRIVRGRILYVGFVYSLGSSDKAKSPGFDYDQSAP
ncbi:MAG TPA: TonB-dependent receptor [Steroidobacteraceae bacterium]|nr:TonB-dependent receptor [Steroidobacteraceae bacterium]